MACDCIHKSPPLSALMPDEPAQPQPEPGARGWQFLKGLALLGAGVSILGSIGGGVRRHKKGKRK